MVIDELLRHPAAAGGGDDALDAGGFVGGGAFGDRRFGRGSRSRGGFRRVEPEGRGGGIFGDSFGTASGIVHGRLLTDDETRIGIGAIVLAFASPRAGVGRHGNH